MVTTTKSHAVVTRPATAGHSRPLVRVYADRTGQMHTSVDIDLARVRDVNVLLNEGRAAASWR